MKLRRKSANMALNLLLETPCLQNFDGNSLFFFFFFFPKPVERQRAVRPQPLPPHPIFLFNVFKARQKCHHLSN